MERGREGTDFWTVWRPRLAWIGGTAAVLLVGFVGWYFWPPAAADAQTPAAGGTIGDQPAATAAAGEPQSRTTQKPAVGPGEVPKVVAIVNGEQITREDLGSEVIRRFGTEVVESLVNKELIIAACRQRGIQVTERDVDAEIERMAAKFGLARDRWLQMLQQERDIDPAKYRYDIIWPTLALKRLAAAELKVTQEEVNQAYESEFGPKQQVRMIAIHDRAKAVEVHQRAVANPSEFKRIAQEHSEDVHSASIGGLIPPVRRHSTDPKIEQAVFALQPGEVSPVLEVAGQHMFFLCERKLPAAVISPQQRQQAIAQLMEQIKERKLRDAASTIFKRLQSQAQVVNVYSDPTLRQRYPGVAASVNGKSISLSELSSECILRHGRDVLEGEINRRLLEQELARRNLKIEDADIDGEIARAAASYDVVQTNGAPDVERWTRQITGQKPGEAFTAEHQKALDIYIRDVVWPSVALKKIVGQEVQVTQEDLQQAFDSNYGPRVEVLAVVVGNERTATKVWEMARDNPTDEFFGQLAHQYSIEPVSKSNFGQVPPISKSGGRDLLEKEAFSLQPGQMSRILAMGEQYIILRCTGMTEPVIKDLATVREDLARDVRETKLRERMGQYFDNLRQAANIDNYLAGSAQVGRAPAARQPAPAAQPGTARRSTSPLAPRR